LVVAQCELSLGSLSIGPCYEPYVLTHKKIATYYETRNKATVDAEMAIRLVAFIRPVKNAIVTKAIERKPVSGQ